jgi:hypothetical protein
MARFWLQLADHMPGKTQSKQFDPPLVVFDLYGDEITLETKPQYSQWYLVRSETFAVNRPNEFEVTTDGINSVFQYSETNVMHFIFNLLRIN